MESNIELHESGQGRNHLPDETVQAGVGGRERSADEGLRSSQESRIKLKQSGQDAVSELRGGGEVVRGGVERDWQWGSSTRWSAVEWILLAYLAGHHAKELLELMPKSILLTSSFLTSKPRERMAALSSRNSIAPDWSASNRCRPSRPQELLSTSACAQHVFSLANQSRSLVTKFRFENVS